jgi:hypothetical protein
MSSDSIREWNVHSGKGLGLCIIAVPQDVQNWATKFKKVRDTKKKHGAEYNERHTKGTPDNQN